jgi:hypothetical protein
MQEIEDRVALLSDRWLELASMLDE